MNRDHIEAEQVVERYLRNELSDSETEQFEARLLWDSEVQDQLALTQRLRQGMRDVAAEQPTTTAAAANRPGILNSTRYAMAASVLLAITSFGWLTTWLNAPTGDGPQASGRVFSLEMLRAAPSLDELPFVTPGAANETVTLLVYPDIETYSQFRAELARLPGPPDNSIDEAWQPVWQGAPTSSGGGDTVAVTLPGTLLEPGVHRLRVTGWENNRADGTPSDIYFRVPQGQ